VSTVVVDVGACALADRDVANTVKRKKVMARAKEVDLWDAGMMISRGVGRLRRVRR